MKFARAGDVLVVHALDRLAVQGRCRAVVGESFLPLAVGAWRGRIIELSATVDAGFSLVLLVSLPISAALRTPTGTVDCCP